jgi:hypothetical protein
VVAEVEVEKTMLGFFVIDEFARISAPAGLAAKLGDFREGRDAVGLAMKKISLAAAATAPRSEKCGQWGTNWAGKGLSQNLP